MIINSKISFKNANFFTFGEKVLARGENYVPVSKADHIEEDEIVYLDYSRYGYEMALYDSIAQPVDCRIIIGEPGSGKTERLLTEMGKTVVNAIKRPHFDTFLKPKTPHVFVLTSFTKAPIESLPDILRRMSLTSKSLINDIKNVPEEWVKAYRQGNGKDWVQYVWGRAKYYYERYKKKDYLYKDEFKANLMPFVIDHIGNINRIIKELNKKVILYIEEASLAPAFVFSEVIKKAEIITCTATKCIRLYDRFLPVRYQKTVCEFVSSKKCQTIELPEISLEVDELIIDCKDAKSTLEKIIHEYNTIAFISDGTIHPKRNDIITKTVFTASSGVQYDVVVYMKGKITTDDTAETYRKIAKSKATELFVEIIPSR